MKKLISWLYRTFVRTSIPTVSDVSFDLKKLPSPKQLAIKAGCKSMQDNGTLALLVSNRANELKKHISLSSPDFYDVELHRVRLFELSTLMSDIARLAKPEREEKKYDPHSIF